MHPIDETLDAYPGKDRARVAPVLSDVACRTEACEIELNIGSGSVRMTRWCALALLALTMTGCQAQTWTAEQRASHEAYLKGSAKCDAMNPTDRQLCYNALPEDLTQINPDEPMGVMLTGIDHLADHLSVQDFYVNGTGGGRAGGGGTMLCCIDLPRVWRPTMVEVRWFVQNWRDCIYEEHVRVVPLERYNKIGDMQVHFLAGGEVRVVSTFWQPPDARQAGPAAPVNDPIPDKNPWHVYPHEACNGRWIERKAEPGHKEEKPHAFR